MRRLWHVAQFAFGPFKRTGSVMNWWPIVAGPLGLILTAIGLAMPHKVGGWWLAIAGLSLTAVVLFAAVYRLHMIAFPDFPRHKIELGRPWIVTDRESDKEKLVLLDLKFTNREANRRVHLNVDVLWRREVKDQSLGPYKLFPRTHGMGNLEVLERPTDIAPEGFVSRAAVFSAVVPGVETGEDTSDLTAPEYIKFFVRLSDDLSGATLDIPLEVARSDDIETALAELAPTDRKVVGFLDVFQTGGLRLGLRNEGSEAVEDQLMNLLVPRSWPIFRPTDENGHPIVRGNLMISDEVLVAPDGVLVPARIWTYREQERMDPGVTNLYFFEYEAEAGEYPVRLRLHGYKPDDLVVRVEPPDMEEAE